MKKQQPAIPKQYAAPKENRVNETDKALLDLKGRIRKVKTYVLKLEKQEEDVITLCKKLILEGKKDRALIQLKKKKFTVAEREKAQNA